MNIFKNINWKTVLAFAFPMALAALGAYSDKQKDLEFEKMKEDLYRHLSKED
jgi:hypothetical protein